MKLDIDFGEEYPSLTVRAVHNYWAKKAAASKLPLLQRFWYDKPWARLLALTKRPKQDSSSDEEDGIPFQGKDTPANHHRKKAMDFSDVEDRLNHARIDLEKIRTIADQIRRREKIKKRLVLTWRSTWQQKLAAFKRPSSKVVKKAKSSVKAKAQAADKANGSKKPKAAEVTKGKSKQKKALPTSKIQRPGHHSADQPNADEPESQPKSAPVSAKPRKVTKALAGQKKLGRYTVREEKEAGQTLEGNDAVEQVLPQEKRKQPNKGKPYRPSAKGRQVQRSDENELEHTPQAGRPDGGAGTAVVAGFSVSLRSTPGKPRGFIEWQADCGHGVFRMDRMAKIVEHFKEHAKCRPEWKQFARKPREKAADHEARLRDFFPFSQSAIAEQVGSKSKAQLSKGRHGKEAALAGVKPPDMPDMEAPPLKEQKRSKVCHASRPAEEHGPEVQAAGVRPLTRSRKNPEIIVAGKPKPKHKSKNRPILERAQAPSRQRAARAAEMQPTPIAKSTRQAQRAVPELQAQQESRLVREPSEEYFEAQEELQSASSSSGSDTYVPADSDVYTSGDEISHPPATRYGNARGAHATLSLRKSAAAHKGSLWQSDRPRPLSEREASDASSLSEGSCPSLFSQDQLPDVKSKNSAAWKAQASVGQSKRKGRKGSNIVAAARRRAELATSQR